MYLWYPKNSIDTFFFDCDSTLSLIEGIDVLATQNGVAELVHQMTERCMATTGLNPEVYRQRLAYVKPSAKQLQNLASRYAEQIAPGAGECIQVLQHLGKTIYILSGGIKAAIVPFAQSLGIAAENVLAVDVYFNEQGEYQDFDEHSNLIRPDGKSREIAKIIDSSSRALLIGDGVSDLEVQDKITRFIGYAGLQAKEKVREKADFFINTPNLYALLPLGLTLAESEQLSGVYQQYYDQGLADINHALVLMKEDQHV